MLSKSPRFLSMQNDHQNESLVSDLMNNFFLIKKKKKGFLIVFTFCRMAETSLRFSISHVTFQEVTSVWGVSAVAILDSSVNCVCVWSTKKLTMLAYCVAANCNNSQMTPGITMHELPCNRPAVRRKWIKFIQFKRADFLAVLQHSSFESCSFV